MSKSPVLSAAQLARRFLELLTLLLPMLPVAYLYLFQDPALGFENHAFHEVAISLALVEGGFISYVSWRCYVYSGEVFVKWLTVGFIGFTAVYSLHGILTPVAAHNIWLFLLYGPASRLLMSACLFIALLKSGNPPDAPATRKNPRFWASWFALFLLINGGVALVAHSSQASAPWVRLTQEFAAIALCLTSIFIIASRPSRSPLMLCYGYALAWFAVSSLAFVLAAPWNHLWWLAHGIFAVGFSILGYGVLRAFLATQSFDRVFNENELFEDLAETNARLKDALAQGNDSNRRLERQIQVSEATREQFAALFNASPDGIVVVETRGFIIKANSRAEEMFGYPQGGLTGRTAEELIPAASRTQHARNRKLYEYSSVTRPMGNADNALTCLRLDGTTFSASISIISLVFEGRQCVVTFIRDMGLLLKFDERQRQSELVASQRGHLVENVMAVAPALLFQFRRRTDGGYEFPLMSPKSQEVLGFDADTLIGQGAKPWFNRVHPGDLSTLIDAIEQAAATRSPWQAHWRACVPDKGIRPFFVHTNLPEAQPDGSLSWTGYMRCIQERKDDTSEE